MISTAMSHWIARSSRGDVARDGVHLAKVMLLERGQHVRHLFGHDARADGSERRRQADLESRAGRDLAGRARLLERGVGVQRDLVVADGRELDIGRLHARRDFIEIDRPAFPAACARCVRSARSPCAFFKCRGRKRVPALRLAVGQPRCIAGEQRDRRRRRLRARFCRESCRPAGRDDAAFSLPEVMRCLSVIIAGSRSA